MRKDPSTQPGVTVWLNGSAITVPAGTMASAVFLAAEVPCRSSVTNEPRTALCGMGICFECRAIVNGNAHRRTCQVVCREGMRLNTRIDAQP